MKLTKKLRVKIKFKINFITKEKINKVTLIKILVKNDSAEFYY